MRRLGGNAAVAIALAGTVILLSARQVASNPAPAHWDPPFGNVP